MSFMNNSRESTSSFRKKGVSPSFKPSHKLIFFYPLLSISSSVLSIKFDSLVSSVIPVKAFNILYFKPFACSYAIFFRTSGHCGNILWSETNTCQGICPPYSGCRLLASIRRNQILWNWSRRGKYDARLQCELRIHCYNHHIIDIRLDFSRRTFGISEKTSHVLELSPRGSKPALAAASTGSLLT